MMMLIQHVNLCKQLWVKTSFNTIVFAAFETSFWVCFSVNTSSTKPMKWVKVHPHQISDLMSSFCHTGAAWHNTQSIAQKVEWTLFSSSLSFWFWCFVHHKLSIFNILGQRCSCWSQSCLNFWNVHGNIQKVSGSTGTSTSIVCVGLAASFARQTAPELSVRNIFTLHAFSCSLWILIKFRGVKINGTWCETSQQKDIKWWMLSLKWQNVKIQGVVTFQLLSIQNPSARGQFLQMLDKFTDVKQCWFSMQRETLYTQ